MASSADCTACSVVNHLARLVSRVLRWPLFLSHATCRHSSRPASIPAPILAIICLTSWWRPISSPNVLRSCAYLTLPLWEPPPGRAPHPPPPASGGAAALL